jgi:diguanylate cyclase (GGDEF)-like protein
MQTGEKGKTPAPGWTVQSMMVGDNHVIGKIIIKGPLIDAFTNKVISIFLAQVAAAAHNKFLMYKLEITANTDGLTGVANRSFFDGELKKTTRNAALFPNIYFSIIMIDINGLKRINDNFGHDKGDEMIRAVANMLSSVCRETDILSRMGGDEFIILMPATGNALAKVAVDRIRSRETGLFLICRQKDPHSQTDFDETTLPIRFSIGVAGSDETLPENVLKLADQRMYIDKENFYQNTIEDTYAGHS